MPDSSLLFSLEVRSIQLVLAPSVCTIPHIASPTQPQHGGPEVAVSLLPGSYIVLLLLCY